jgi:hypothetical protein
MSASGARQLRLRDWPFGAVGRRLLLEALLLDEAEEGPSGGWTKRALETRAGVATGGIDDVLAGALQLKLVERRNARWIRPEEQPGIAEPLIALLSVTRSLPDAAIQPIPRRNYRRRS